MISTLIRIITVIVCIVASDAVFAAEILTEDDMGRITAQDGATFVLENFDFYIFSPGVQYIESQESPESTISDNPDSLNFQDVVIHDGYYGPVEMSTNLDWDIFSQTINGIGHNYARFAFYNTDLNFNLDISNLRLTASDDSGTTSNLDLGGILADNISIDQMTLFLGGASNNTGISAEINLSMSIDAMTIDAMRYQDGIGAPVIFENITVAGSFSGSETPIDNSKAYTATGGLWSEERASEYAGVDAEFEEELLSRNRWVPDPDSWVPYGCLKIGDIENGNPMTMDFSVDSNAYIPFPYDIVSGEPSQDDRVEWYEPANDKHFHEARGWKDGKDNYISEGNPPTSIKNPRYGKAYIAMDAPIIGSLRIGSEGGDIIILDGVNLNLRAEIPGYGYGDTPNSIPRPFPDPQLAEPVYDAPFDDLWRN